jgi:TolB-like protein/Tfp pilus assembly protein PilF
VKLAELIAEAKRRNVFRAAGLYAGFAFVALQLADILFPIVGIADDNVTFLLIAIAIGFPFAVVGSWYIELTADGIKITSPISPEQREKLGSGKIVDIVILLLALGVGFLYLERFGSNEKTESEPTTISEPTFTETSVAVLPFENLSSSEENAFFAAGIHEDILNSLSQNPELVVTSRTSTLVYEGSKKPIADIAQELDVSYVMEGSVRRAGNRVRISVQLIEARTDKHVWSQAFERDLDNVFAIQVEVAEQVAAALEVQFSGKSKVDIQVIDVDAYDLFVSARVLAATYQSENLQKAVSLYEQALRIDPDYMDAWAGLSMALSYARFLGGSVESNFTAIEAADSAVALDPNAWLANYAMGLHLGSQDIGRFAEANRFFDKAILANPNDADLLFDYGFTLTFQTRFSDAIEVYEKAYRRNPLAANSNIGMAFTAAIVNDRSALDRHLDRALLLAKENAYIAWAAGVARWRIGDFEGAVRQLDEVNQAHPQFLQSRLWMSGVFRDLGDFDTVAYWLEEARKIDPDNTGLMFRLADNFHSQGDLQGRMDHISEWNNATDGNMVARLYEPAVKEIEAKRAYDLEDTQTYYVLVQEQLDLRQQYIKGYSETAGIEVYFWNSWAFISAAINAKQLGDDELAYQLSQKIIEHFHDEVGPAFINLVFAYALIGENERAIEQMNLMLDSGYGQLSLFKRFGLLDNEYGVYGNITNNVGFIDVVARFREHNAKILAKIRADYPQTFPPEV